MKKLLLHYFSVVLLLLPCEVLGKRINVHTLDELIRTSAAEINSTIVVKKDINLNGRTVILGDGIVLSFKGGSLRNGTVMGTKTKLKKTRANVFHDCNIRGEWDVDCVYSTMFDRDVEALTLLKNMSCLSPVLKLLANRSYEIHALGEIINAEILEGDGRVKPIIVFHTIDPNVEGLVISGANVTLRNLKVIDDYDVKNDALYGENRPTIGNTISVKGPKNEVQNLIVDNCDFQGGTSSSWVASSQTRNCRVRGCTFTGYMADHGVYCSVKVETFMVDRCNIYDVSHVSGLFKIRTSDRLQYFSLSNVTAHNFNGYLAFVSLLETPLAEIVYDHVTVTKDAGNTSIFYGFCMGDEREGQLQNGYNANCITVSNCSFRYGYNSNSVIYPGSGNKVCVKEVVYKNVCASESNFGGGVVDRMVVNNSQFYDCVGEKGISINTKALIMKNCLLQGGKNRNCLFLVNYDNQRLEYFSMHSVEIDIQTKYLISVVGGEKIKVSLYRCSSLKPIHSILNSGSYKRARLQMLKCDNLPE